MENFCPSNLFIDARVGVLEQYAEGEIQIGDVLTGVPGRYNIQMNMSEEESDEQELLKGASADTM